MSTKRKPWILLIAALISGAGCGSGKVTIEERIFPNKNSTIYVFNASASAVKEAINTARGEKWRDAQPPHQGCWIAWKGEGNLFAKKALKDAGTSDVAFLYGMGDSVGKSRLYVKDGNELTYYADFKIVLTPTNASKTRVEIFPQNCKVLAGTEWHPFAEAGIWVDVEPTSVEEYQVLLDIGKQLGVQDMPKLITPDPKSPIRKLKRPRSH